MNSKRTTFTARCEPKGGGWAVQVPEVEGCSARASRLDQVESSVREALSRLLQTSWEAVDVQVKVELPADWAETVRRTRQLREEARARQLEAAAATDQALEVLVGHGGLPVRDAGRILGIPLQVAGRAVGAGRNAV